MGVNEDVTESKAITRKIRKICVEYMKLMIQCAESETIRDKFMADPHKYLRDIGMKIPESAHVILDNKNPTWPVVYMKGDDETIIVTETKLGVEVMEDFKVGADSDEDIHRKQQGEVDVKITEKLSDFDVVVSLPFFDAHTDMLTDIKFSDGAEIILSCP